MHTLPRLVRFALLYCLIHLGLFLLLRLGLYSYFDSSSNPVPTADIAEAFYVGSKFDLRLTLLMLLPLLLLGGIRSLSPFEHHYLRHFWNTYLTVVFAAIISLYFINYGHYSYLQKPLDASALRFLQNFSTSMEMVWDTYPVVWINLLLLSLVAAYAWLINRMFLMFADVVIIRLPRWRRVSTGVVTAFVVIFALYGKVSYYPLRWSDAFFSTHNFTSAVAMNPVLYALNTLKNRDISFDEKAFRKAYPLIADYLGVEKPDIHSLDLSRRVIPEKRFATPPNIVVVILESFAAYRTNLGNNPMNATPYFESLARQGIYFDRFFTPSTGTARSVWTFTTGIPDIETNKTSTRNPIIVNQHNLFTAFRGYEKHYFIGGSASWGNIRGLLQSNIPGLHLHEEGEYTAPRMDVWGLSDLHLFEEANKVLSREQEPFFAIIQTSGNHRPYNIPQDSRGFTLRKEDGAKLRDYGYESNEEFNAFRFMDHSVGFYMETAKKETYFDNTIFVFFGDHGLPGAGKHMPAWKVQLPSNALNVPLVFYAPKLLPPAVKHGIASEVDVMPTIASLAGLPYTNTTLGRDLLDNRFDQQRHAFAIEHGHNPLIGLLGDEFAYFSHVDGKNPVLNRYAEPTPRDDVSSQYPQQASTLRELTFSLYETIRYLRYHNRPRPHPHLTPP